MKTCPEFCLSTTVSINNKLLEEASLPLHGRDPAAKSLLAFSWLHQEQFTQHCSSDRGKCIPVTSSNSHKKDAKCVKAQSQCKDSWVGAMVKNSFDKY